MSVITKRFINRKADQPHSVIVTDGLEEAIARAEERLEIWQKKSFDERASLLHQLAAQTRKGTDQLSQLITQEIDKLLVQGQHEMSLI